MIAVYAETFHVATIVNKMLYHTLRSFYKHLLLAIKHALHSRLRKALSCMLLTLIIRKDFVTPFYWAFEFYHLQTELCIRVDIFCDELVLAEQMIEMANEINTTFLVRFP